MVKDPERKMLSLMLGPSFHRDRAEVDGADQTTKESDHYTIVKDVTSENSIQSILYSFTMLSEIRVMPTL